MTGKLARPAAVTAFFLLFFPLWLSAMETEGYASWYGGKFQGRRTANGEIFDTNKLTAAHKSLPFGTKVRVTDLESEKSVIVRINDRGPFVENRIIDLSKAAADIIGLTPRGVGRVRLEIVHREPEAAFLTIQVAAFGSRDNAQRLRNRLFEAGFAPSIETTEAGHFRVLLEHLPVGELEPVREKLLGMGFGGIIVRGN
jgi:rare lipoprotein A